MAGEYTCVIRKHERTAPDTYTLLLEPEQEIPFKPGQFTGLAVPGFSLRRPLSVTDCEGGTIRLTYQLTGPGTRALSEYTGETLNLLAPLGNGFLLPERDEELLLLGGGIGTAPLIFLAREALKRGAQLTAVFGFRSPERTLFQKELAGLDIKTFLCYDSEGENVVSVLKKEGLAGIPFAACGPLAMLQAVDEVMEAPGQFSLECRMGCGFGACMGCSVKMRSGMRRICKDGPVFDRKEVLWESFR